MTFTFISVTVVKLSLSLVLVLTRQQTDTHVYDIGQVVDVVFKHGGVCGLQSQQILIPGFKSLQFVL